MNCSIYKLLIWTLKGCDINTNFATSDANFEEIRIFGHILLMDFSNIGSKDSCDKL